MAVAFYATVIFISGTFTLGRLERIGLSMRVPQTRVLPLNYSRHESAVQIQGVIPYIVTYLYFGV
jgi:hypothetical protein